MTVVSPALYGLHSKFRGVADETSARTAITEFVKHIINTDHEINQNMFDVVSTEAIAKVEKRLLRYYIRISPRLHRHNPSSVVSNLILLLNTGCMSDAQRHHSRSLHYFGGSDFVVWCVEVALAYGDPLLLQAICQHSQCQDLDLTPYAANILLGSRLSGAYDENLISNSVWEILRILLYYHNVHPDYPGQDIYECVVLLFCEQSPSPNVMGVGDQSRSDCRTQNLVNILQLVLEKELQWAGPSSNLNCSSRVPLDLARMGYAVNATHRYPLELFRFTVLEQRRLLTKGLKWLSVTMSEVRFRQHPQRPAKDSCGHHFNVAYHALYDKFYPATTETSMRIFQGLSSRCKRLLSIHTINDLYRIKEYMEGLPW